MSQSSSFASVGLFFCLEIDHGPLSIMSCLALPPTAPLLPTETPDFPNTRSLARHKALGFIPDARVWTLLGYNSFIPITSYSISYPFDSPVTLPLIDSLLTTPLTSAALSLYRKSNINLPFHMSLLHHGTIWSRTMLWLR